MKGYRFIFLFPSIYNNVLIQYKIILFHIFYFIYQKYC